MPGNGAPAVSLQLSQHYWVCTIARQQRTTPVHYPALRRIAIASTMNAASMMMSPPASKMTKRMMPAAIRPLPRPALISRHQMNDSPIRPYELLDKHNHV